MAQLPSQSSFGDYADWPGRDVLDSGGERLGGVREIYLDRETGRPEWVLVDVDHADARFVPLADASVESSTIRVAHAATTVRTAPGIGTEPRIDQSEERRLYAHYGLGYAAEDTGSEQRHGTPEAPASQAPPESPASWNTPEAARQSTDETAPPTAWGAPDETTSSWGTPDTTMRDAAATGTTPPWRTAEPTPAVESETPAADAGTWGAAETTPDATPLSAAPTDEPTGRDLDETPSWALPSSPESETAPAADAPTSEFEAAYEAASNDAPPPAEPPSPEELEAADIPEPPAATERAFDYDAPTEAEPPVLAAPAEPVALEPPPEPAALEPPAVPEPAPPAEPAVELPPPSVAAFTPPAETPPPAAADTSRASSFDAPPSRPAWSSPEPEPQPSGGPLAVIKSRPGGIAAAVAVAAVLFMIIRRLR